MSSCFSRCLRVPIAIRAFYESGLWILQTLLLKHPDLHPGLLGLGPTAVAFFTQHVFGRDSAVPYSLAIVTSAACALGAALLYAALKPFLVSLEGLKRHIESGA